jgi:hypothetical protein
VVAASAANKVLVIVDPLPVRLRANGGPPPFATLTIERLHDASMPTRLDILRRLFQVNVLKQARIKLR